MRIDPTLVVASIPKDKSEIPEPKKTASGSSASIVKLSAAATSAAQSAEPKAADPARLATIKMQIEKGTYPIDLDKLASRIVEDDEGRSK